MINKENLKVDLISLQEDAERVPPVGLVYIATYLRDRIGLKDENIRILDINYTDIEKELKKFPPHIIGFTAMTVEYGKVIRFAQRIKQKFKIPFIIGGVHISTLPESLDRVFDIGVIGEGEETIGELIELYLRQNEFNIPSLKKIKGIFFSDKDKSIITEKREPVELDKLPVPDFKFAHKNYFRKEEIPAISDVGIRAYLISSRGCPYRCVFCSTSRFWGKMRLHSADFTARILKKFIDDFGSNYIKVLDDLFTLTPERVRELREAFEKYDLLDKIKAIECQPRANLISEELCKEMKKIKIKTLNFGFESGSDRVLKWLKQNSATVKMNKKAILLCQKYDFNIYGSLIYSSPWETLEDMKKTNQFIDFAIDNNARYIWSFIATPFPGTPFWDIAIERGKVSNNMDWGLLSHHNIENPLLLDEDIDKKEFKRVFLKGRKKLRKLKIKLISEFILKNPLATMRMVVKEPKYYATRVVKQVYRQ